MSWRFIIFAEIMSTERMMKLLRQCTEDIAGVSGVWGLDAQVRAYDLLDMLLSLQESGYGGTSSDGFRSDACRYIGIYKENASEIDGWYDETSLRSELAARLLPYDEALNEARFEAASAAGLHEFAKEVYDIWQTSGVFARRRALRELRERAGFRLESHRIGNYVAKTFDLMNEAQTRFAKAQQARFAADVAYKITAGLHGRIFRLLEGLKS